MRKIKSHTSKDLNELLVSLCVTRSQLDQVVSKYPPLITKYPNSIYYQQFKKFKIEDFIQIEKDKMIYGWSFVKPIENENNQEFKDFCKFIEFINQEIFYIFGFTTFYGESVQYRFSDNFLKQKCRDYLNQQNEVYISQHNHNLLEYVDLMLCGIVITDEIFIKIINDLTDIQIKECKTCTLKTLGLTPQ